MTRSVLVAESARRVDVVWGFLTLVFAAALVRGHLGTGTTTGRVVVDVVGGALLAGSIGAWIWFRRHPARIEIAPAVVAFSHRGQKATTLVGPGELYVHTTHIGGTDRLHFLKVTGSDESIPLQMFDQEEVKTACRAGGWRFVGDGERAAMTKPYPWFYAVNDRPVQIVQTPDGGADCLVLDMRTGNFVPDRSYFAHVAPGSGKDVDAFTATQFSQLVATHRAGIVHKLATRMCAAMTTSEQDLLAALAVPLDPPPLGGTDARVRGGDIPTFEVDVPDGLLTRSDLDARLGDCRRLPRSGPHSSILLAYDVAVPDTAHRCSVFARFAEGPRPTSAVAGVLLRLDPAATT